MKKRINKKPIFGKELDIRKIPIIRDDEPNFRIVKKGPLVFPSKSVEVKISNEED